MKRIMVVGVRGIPDVVGGGEKHAERLFPLIAERGWQICLVGRKPYLQAGQYREICLWSAPSLGSRIVDSWLYTVTALFKAWQMRPDIVHFVGLKSISLLWAYRLAGCKTVVRYGADCDARQRPGPSGWAMKWTRFQLRWADSIVAVTPALANRLRPSAKAHKIHVIGNALDRAEDFPYRLPAPVSGEYILFVGQILRKKDISGLISAFRVFAKSHSKMQLVIVGDWTRQAGRNEIVAMADKRIVMLGSLPRSELGPLYRGARFFVNPSIREGHSNSLLEAISLGCPVLLSDFPENRDLRLNAKYYFDPENLRSMVSAFNRAHANPALFRVAADRFPQWEDIADQVIDVYDRLFVDDAEALSTQGAASRI